MADTSQKRNLSVQALIMSQGGSLVQQIACFWYQCVSWISDCLAKGCAGEGLGMKTTDSV